MMHDIVEGAWTHRVAEQVYTRCRHGVLHTIPCAECEASADGTSPQAVPRLARFPLPADGLKAAV